MLWLRTLKNIFAKLIFVISSVLLPFVLFVAMSSHRVVLFLNLRMSSVSIFVISSLVFLNQ